jgi:hypothetical protein
MITCANNKNEDTDKMEAGDEGLGGGEGALAITV